MTTVASATPSMRSVSVFPEVDLIETSYSTHPDTGPVVVRELWIEGTRLVMPSLTRGDSTAFTVNQGGPDGMAAVTIAITPMVRVSRCASWAEAHATPALNPAHENGPRWLELFCHLDDVPDVLPDGFTFPAPRFGARIGERWIWQTDDDISVVNGHRRGENIVTAAVEARVRLIARGISIRHESAGVLVTL